MAVTRHGGSLTKSRTDIKPLEADGRQGRPGIANRTGSANALSVGRRYFITGTDTGVGKTVLTVLLVRLLRAQGRNAAAVKPFCSGGRGDAEALFAAQDGALTLAQINPWHFQAPLTPLLAARRERKRISRDQALGFLRHASRQCDHLLVEGAGGLLSPLGEDYSARELIAGIRAIPFVVCTNRLGAINQARLVMACLPPVAAHAAKLILMESPQPDRSASGNRALLKGLFGPGRVVAVPWLGETPLTVPLNQPLQRALKPLLA